MDYTIYLRKGQKFINSAKDDEIIITLVEDTGKVCLSSLEDVDDTWCEPQHIVCMNIKIGNYQPI